MISNLAYIHPDARLGKDVVVEPFAYIAGDVVIGDGSWIGPHAVILDGARMGKGCKRIGKHQVLVQYVVVSDRE